MKKLLTLVVVMAFYTLSYGQNNTVNNNVTAQQMANNLLGYGVDLISATYSGNSASKGIFKTNAISQMPEGIILSTGQVNNDIFLPSLNFNSHSLGNSGDADLLSLYNSVGYDAASLEVVVRPRGTKLSFQYIFASEEYPGYVCQANDMFALLIKPNIANSTYQNIAIVPGTNYPISINTIHQYATPCSGYPQSYSQYYQTPSGIDSFIFNGRTVLLTAEFTVVPCQEYRLKFVIHDQMDNSYNSAIYIKANSLNSTGVTINSNNTNVVNGVKQMIKNCEKDTIEIVRNPGIVGDIDIHVAKSGTAVQGVDYLAIEDSFKLLNAQQQYNIPVVPIGNSNIDRQLVLKFYRKFPNCSNGIELIFIDSIIYNFKNLPKPANLNNTTLCNNNNHQLNISNTFNYDSIKITPNVGLNNYNTFNPIFSGVNSQTYYVTLFKNGCNRIDTFTIIRQVPPNTSISDSICASSLPYAWKGDTVNTIGTHTLKDTTVSSLGCDSIVTLTLKVFPNPTNPTLSQTICQQTLPFVWNGQTINSVGNHTLTYTKKSIVSNCDSTTTLSLTVNPTKTHSTSTTICQQNLPFVWNGLTVNTVGTHTLNYTNASVLTGCDSTTTLTLTVNPTKAHSISQTICQTNLPYNWNGQIVNTVGTHTLNYTKASVLTGCDSTTTLTLTVNPTKTHSISQTICQTNLPYNWNGQIVNTVGNHTLTYTISSVLTGCDSVTTLNLTVNANITQAITQTICQQNLPFVWNGQTINAIGSFNLSHTTASVLTGCDSTTNLTLTVNPTKTHSLNQTICQQNLPFVWNGLTVNTVGNHTINYTKASVLTGCDSITTLNLTVNPTKTHLEKDTICQSALPYVWNGLTINSVGTHTLNYTKPSVLTGCDSITTLNLLVRPNPVVNLGADQNSCVNIGWNYTLNAGNTGAHFLWNTQDTTQTINVNQNGTYYVSVTNSFGCISHDTVLINFRANPVISLMPDTNLCEGDSIVLDATYANAASYTWNTSATTASIVVKTGGNFVVNVLGTNGCSSKDSTYVTLRQNPVLDLGPNVEKCINVGDLHFIDAGNPGLNYLWDNNYNGQVRVVNTSGQYWAKVTNVWQCFDTDTINILLKHNPEVNLGNDTNICEDGHIILDAGSNGINYYWNTGSTNPQNKVSLGGTYYVAVTGANGCLGGDTINITQSGKMPKFDNIWITNLATHTFKFSVLNPQYIIGYFWDFGDGAAPAYSSNPEHTYPTHGNYLVTLRASSSCGVFTDTSTVHIYTTGIKDYNINTDNISIYPNPTNDNVTISTNDQTPIEEITLINAIGQIMHQQDVHNKQSTTINVNNLPAGTYHVNVKTPKAVLHKKLVIAR